MFPFTSTTSPPASLAIRKAPDVRECQCGIHTAEAASALRSRKTERAAKGKPAQPHNFFSSCRAPVPVQFVRPAGVPTLRLAQSYAFTADFLAGRGVA